MTEERDKKEQHELCWQPCQVNTTLCVSTRSMCSIYCTRQKQRGDNSSSSAHVQSINPRLIRSLLLLRVTIEINTKKKRGKIGD